jgi:hypothetical protein
MVGADEKVKALPSFVSIRVKKGIILEGPRKRKQRKDRPTINSNPPLGPIGFSAGEKGWNPFPMIKLKFILSSHTRPLSMPFLTPSPL